MDTILIRVLGYVMQVKIHGILFTRFIFWPYDGLKVKVYQRLLFILVKTDILCVFITLKLNRQKQFLVT